MAMKLLVNDLVNVSELFHVQYGVNLELVNLEQCVSSDANSVPFVARKGGNNGVSAYVLKKDGLEPNPPNTLSVAGGGSVLSTFYQPLPYYSGRDLYVLIPKKDMSLVEMLFYARCIESNKYKYSYGRQANRTLTTIRIPSKMPEDYVAPLLIYYENSMRQITPRAVSKDKISLKTQSWQRFKLGDIFEIKGSKTTSLDNLVLVGLGKRPYVTTKATNNGVSGFYDLSTEDGNILVAESAVSGYCSYQALDFSASDHVEKLVPKFPINKYIAMFLTTIVNRERYRYNYGVKANQQRLRQTRVKLPSKGGEPDWAYMEKFIKSLPYSATI